MEAPKNHGTYGKCIFKCITTVFGLFQKVCTNHSRELPFINTSKSNDNKPSVLFLKGNCSRLREVTFELVYVFKPERLKGES